MLEALALDELFDTITVEEELLEVP